MFNKYKNIKNILAVPHGFFRYTKESCQNVYSLAEGDKRIKKLTAEIKANNIAHNIEYKKIKSMYPYMDCCLISGLSIPNMLDNGVAPEVAEAYRYAFPEKAKLISFDDAWLSYETVEQKMGFVNAVKGKLFEIKYLDHINQNSDLGYSAKLADSPVQARWDIEISGPDNSVVNQMQLKASDSISYVKSALDKNPNIDVVTLEDFNGQTLLADYSDRITESDISDAELLSQIEESGKENIELFFPALGLMYIVFDGYKKNDLTFYKKTENISYRLTDYVSNLAILSLTSPFIGIPLILSKHYYLKRGEKMTNEIKFLKKQLKLQKKSQRKWNKKFNRREILKSLTITPMTISPIKS